MVPVWIYMLKIPVEEGGSKETEFNKFEPRLKYKPGLKYGWFHLKLYSIFQNLSRGSIETDLWGIWDAA